MEWRHGMSDPSTVAGREHLLALLQKEQDKTGHISEQFIEQTAKSSGLTASEVYGVATFYHLLSTKPLGRNVIRVCKCVPCYLKNSHLVLETIQEKLGIAPGETTPDGRFSLLLTNCIGACDQAPAMLLNHDLYGYLTPAKIAEILEACL
jgi:NADH-quinone oxidoreductase subunit E